MLATYIFRWQKEFTLVEAGNTVKGKKHSKNGAEEEGAVFRQNNFFRQNRSIWVSKC